MSAVRMKLAIRTILLTIAVFAVTGCATNRINWESRVGDYTMDQAIVELGPPDKVAKLSDGGTVAEWLTRRGYSYTHMPYSYGFQPYGFYPYHYETFTAPDYFLRLIFDPQGQLTSWRTFPR